ncbi:hypothetical protein [Aeromicrobium sp. UC242_57]|uniref:hypothetical protein n=1 Tax=Aeromicrobium sp. UC242_57 TaxID=3374624 RepID=UPI0037BC3D10
MTLAASVRYALSAVSKFFRSAAVNCPTFAFSFDNMWIASKYASNWGDRLTVLVHKVARSDTRHKHARDAVRLLGELKVCQRTNRRIDRRDQVGHLRFADPCARHAPVQVHDHWDRAETVLIRLVSLNPFAARHLRELGLIWLEERHL